MRFEYEAALLPRIHGHCHCFEQHCTDFPGSYLQRPTRDFDCALRSAGYHINSGECAIGILIYDSNVSGGIECKNSMKRSQRGALGIKVIENIQHPLNEFDFVHCSLRSLCFNVSHRVQPLPNTEVIPLLIFSLIQTNFSNVSSSDHSFDLLMTTEVFSLRGENLPGDGFLSKNEYLRGIPA